MNLKAIGSTARRIASVLAACAATVAAAQTALAVAGAWFDAGGDEVNISSRSFPYDRLTAGDRDVGGIVALFDEACLRAGVGTDGARPAIQSRPDWGFRYLDVDAGVPSGARLDGWQAADVSVTSATHVWPLAQCNVLADRKALEPADPVVSALSARLGRQPDRRFKTRSADGRHVQGQSFRWDVTGPALQPRHVYASSYVDRNGAFTLHLGLTEARPK